MPDPSPSPDVPILNFLKQRFPLLMVDRVLSVEPGRKIKTLKNISVNEIHFKGHFPEHPVFPGVLTIECFAQTAAILIHMIDGETPGMFDVIGSVMNFHFIRPLEPGDRLEVRMEITKTAGINRIIKGQGFVDGQMVASGAFVFGKLVQK